MRQKERKKIAYWSMKMKKIPKCCSVPLLNIHSSPAIVFIQKSITQYHRRKQKHNHCNWYEKDGK